jgi:hypothetical protein
LSLRHRVVVPMPRMAAALRRLPAVWRSTSWMWSSSISSRNRVPSAALSKSPAWSAMAPDRANPRSAGRFAALAHFLDPAGDHPGGGGRVGAAGPAPG